MSSDSVSSYLSRHHYRVLDLTEASDLYYYLYLRASPRPLLDVGCNVGNLLSVDPAQSVGVDVDPHAIEICHQRGLDAHCADLNEPMAFADATFGTVNCRHVIEHVREPIALMRDMRRVLVPSGVLLLETPDFRNAYRTFFDDHTHLRPLTAESARRLALDAGFTDIRIRHEVSRIGLRQIVRRGYLSAAASAQLYRAAYRLGLRQRKTLVMVCRASQARVDSEESGYPAKRAAGSAGS
jgi:SAM-dependent methyltransferase